MSTHYHEPRELSKKIFFLYPHSVIQDQLLTVLIQSEYEVSVVSDHRKVTGLLNRYPHSILFINIEAEMPEESWEKYIRDIVADTSKNDARVGILTYNPSPDLAEKYLMNIGVQCGFIALKLGLTESAKIILKTLEANEAKGGRQYVRVKCPKGKTSFNFNQSGRILKGEILDISSTGMACILSESLRVQTTIDDVQLVLWGTILKVDGKVMGVRTLEDGCFVHVLLFAETMPRESKSKLYQFIRKVLQTEIDAQ